MDMHDCPFLLVLDIHEDLKFVKIRFLEEGNITATVRSCFVILGQLFVELQSISQLSF